MRNLKILSLSKSQPTLSVQKTDSGNEKSFGKLLGNWLDEWCLPVFVVLFLLGDALVACLGLPADALKFLLGAVLMLLLLLLCFRQYRFLCCVGLLLGMIWCGLPLASIESFPTAAYHSMDFTGKVVEVYDEKTDYLNTMGSEGEVNFEKATTFIFQTTKPGAWRGKVMATVYGVDVKVGDRLSFVGIVRPQSHTHNWNLQNQDDYLRNQGVAAAVRVIGSSIQMEAMQKNHLLKSAALDARARIDVVLSALPEYQQNFIKGIAFGDKSGLSGQQMQVLSQTGIMDAFAVSGMHMGFVVLFAAALGNFLNRLFPFRRSFRMILIVVFALFYGMMTGFPPSVLRATVMSLAAAFALLYGEKNRSKLMILYAAFVCVLLQPFVFFDVGFQLSFLAAAGIVFTQYIWKSLLRWPSLQITMAAQMMITPLLVYYFSVMTLIGFFLSPLAAACAGIVVILVLCAIPLVYLGLGDIPLYGAGILAQLVYEISQWFARLPYTWFAIPKPHWVVLLLYFALLATGYYCLQRWQKQQNLPEIIQPEGILTRVQKM